LGLAEAGVDWDAKGGVSVDEKLRTKNPRIYAAGDICSGRKFTHAADAQARIVLRNALFFGRSREAALIMPWCTYTEPEVAQVGLTEEAARKANLTIRTLVQPMNKVDRAVLSSETEGFVKVVLKAGSDQILGATIVGSNAGEMISEITVAMVAGKGLGTLAQVIHPYPTRAEALKKLGDAFMREKLTPWVKTLLNYWLRMGR
jgi:pyruvate/2-oxoglutarate dehydrogenase complex dihydrolipoamide dehydrogenase (E3) component